MTVADDVTTEQHSLESKERASDVVRVCGTDNGGDVLMIDGSMLAIYDRRHRCIARITDLTAIYDVFDGLEI